MTIGQRAKQGFLRLPPSVQRQVLHGLGRYAPWEPEFDFTPPPPGPGQVVGPPDFVGIGAQKAGTTWWYHLLASHPGVAASDGMHKERHFFDRFGALPFRPSDAEQYQGWFPHQPGQVSGEWTPDYISLPWVPDLLVRAAPEVRLLVLLRDPVERFRSGLAHQRRMGQSPTGASAADALERGCYYRALIPWLERFDRSRILILQYERCVADPGGQYRATTDFLGLSPYLPPDADRAEDSPVDGSSAHRHGPTGSALDPDVIQRLQSSYEADVTALVTLVPDFDLALWPHFAYLAGEPPSSPTVRP